jgi:hypothetical protein
MIRNFTIILVAIAFLAPSVCAQTPDLHWLDQRDAPADFFPIMTWATQKCINEAAIQEIADCNFTLVGFVTSSDLPACEKLGLKAIVRDEWQLRWVTSTDEAIDAAVKKKISEWGDSKAIIGYYIHDEPGASYFAKLGSAVAAVRKHAPGKLAYINLFPNHTPAKALGTDGYTEHLERYVAETKPQMISYDNYMVMYSDDGQELGQFASYLRNLIEVRRVSLKHGIPFWNIVSCCQIRHYTTPPSPANLMYQAYTTLAAGARGITWYRYGAGGYGYAPIDSSCKRTESWHYLKMVNQQIKVLGPVMNRLTTTGLFFTGSLVGDMKPLPGQIVKSVESTTSVQGYSDVKPPVMVGEFTGEDGYDYAMIVNLSMERSANIKAQTVKDYSARERISAEDASASPLDETNGHWLVPGQGVLVRFRAN